MKLSVCLLLATIVLTASVEASADSSSSAVVINQQTLLTGLPGCSKGGFPITICAPGSYRLGINLHVDQATTAILITASNVTLDLGGFAILGPNRCAFNSGPITTTCTYQQAGGVGIAGQGGNIEVLNGQVSGMGSDGIALTPAQNVVDDASSVENVKVSESGNNGITLVSGLVRGCTVSNNAAMGIQLKEGLVIGNYIRGSGLLGVAGTLDKVFTVGVTNNVLIDNVNQLGIATVDKGGNLISNDFL